MQGCLAQLVTLLRGFAALWRSLDVASATVRELSNVMSGGKDSLTLGLFRCTKTKGCMCNTLEEMIIEGLYW